MNYADSMSDEDVACRDLSDRLNHELGGELTDRQLSIAAAFFKEGRQEAVDGHEIDPDDEVLEPVREASYAEGVRDGKDEAKDQLNPILERLTKAMESL